MKNLKIIDELIVGRVEPCIYAFSTNTIPNYLKVGDTYRPLSVRINEWKKHFPNLELQFDSKALVDTNVFFRDYSVHDYLENKGKHRLLKKEMSCFPSGTYYSKEFFKASIDDLKEAIEDIAKSYKNKDNKYQFYNSNTALPVTYTYASTGYWKPRPNQQDAINNFKKAVDEGRNNLLMYAVMRFGKSFTALCCAKEITAKTVLVVSAKADIREEWKKTVQSADNFNKDYVFLSSDELIKDRDAIQNAKADRKGTVIFLTLQDLQGNEIKEKHQKLFKSEIDLLIVDETHYGARAESYGQIIRTAGYKKDIKLDLTDEGDDYVEFNDADEQLKKLNVKVKLHLSGTPYRILMGSEFSKEDIISFCQFSDIVREQKEWDKKNILDDEDQDEWNNPYFGFPQMIRFAFNPSASALALLEKLKSSGNTYALSELFKPRSISKKNDSSHKKFKHENEVMDLFKAIDGSKDDENIFAFLDYDKIHKGKMCRHIVIVLPYCASCDALESLLTDNVTEFKNLGEYEIINISGVDGAKDYPTVKSVKEKIERCEIDDQKTITLTVNRMLTGSTVEQWDTMIFLKDTASPQEYDQAIFRLQNQYVKSYIDDNKEIKYNMKPQTLLIDFAPHRMFIMQEQKSLIYNMNTDRSGNDYLEERMESELQISPIITINKGKIKQVTATDILSIVSEYSSSRGVKDEANDIPVDNKLFEIPEIKTEIEHQAELGSKGGLKVEAHKGDKTDFDNPGDDNDGSSSSGKTEDEHGTGDTDGANSTDVDKTLQILQNKFKTYYSRILFFAFLTEDTVSSLSDIIKCRSKSDNMRIMKNLELDIDVLKIILESMNPSILNILDYKIQNINKLSHDKTVPPIDRAITAIGKFGKLSESEVTTPISVATDMVNLLPEDCFTTLNEPQNKILDIASKMGEFAFAICRRCEKLGIDIDEIQNSIQSIPTSQVAYEFTRKVYKILGLNVDCIAAQFTSYDLLTIKHKNEDKDVDYEKISKMLQQNVPFSDLKLNDEGKDKEIQGDQRKFNAIVGNPPFHVDDGGAGASSTPIYPVFINIAKETNTSYYCIITPSKWFTGGKHLDKFREAMLGDVGIKELHDYLYSKEIFPDTNNRGGICYLLWDREYDNTKSESKVKVVTHEGNGFESEVIRSFKTGDLDIFIRNSKAIGILDKVILQNTEVSVMRDYISSRKPFSLGTDFINTEDFHQNDDGLKEPITCYGGKKSVGFIEKSLITKNQQWIDSWKVYMPYTNNIATELNDDNQNSFVGEPKSVCTETFLAVGTELNLNKNSAENLSNYLKTKFARFLLSLAKTSQHGTRETYRFVPVQDFSEPWTDEKLYTKYGLLTDQISFIEDSIKEMK